MKFSVLLPTRNRLELLRYAVESVRRQDFDDWEIIVSDNASEEDVRGYVASLADARVRYVRTASFVPVTENWNNALRQASGDYFLMLGDDDAVMPGYFRELAAHCERYAYPDVLYTDAYQYAYPNVIPGHASGFVQRGYSEFLYGREVEEPFWLTPAQAVGLVSKSMSFRIAFGFNMQHYLVGRRMLAALQPAGDFYQSPYPDYYAANALLLQAQKILIVPQPRVAIGISPKSFGYYFFNNKEDEGDTFLKNLPDPALRRQLEDVVLPGSSLMTSWLYAMETLKSRQAPAAALRIDYRRYRLIQVYTVFVRAGVGGALRLISRLRVMEIFQCVLLAIMLLALKLAPAGLRKLMWRRVRDSISPFPEFDLKQQDVPYRNILEFFESARRDAGTVRPLKSHG